MADDVTGPDLEYDLSFLELSQVVLGRAETQFMPAEAPDWTAARELAHDLLDRTRDLRVALIWGRAAVHLDGLQGLAPALALLHGMLDRFWPELHPRPDPHDTENLARLSILCSLDALDGLLGDVRQASLATDRALGGLQVRDVEISLARLSARAGDALSTPGQIQGRLGEQPALARQLGDSIEASLRSLRQLQVLMNDRFGAHRAVDTRRLQDVLVAVSSLLPASTPATAPETGPGAGIGGEDGHAEAPDRAVTPRLAALPRHAGNGVESIDSRHDAVRAIRLVCAYLELSEPTNPAQLLLRRAERLIDKDFLQLVRDLAPASVDEVARVLGMDPQGASTGSSAR